MYKYEIDIDNNYTYRSKYHHLTYGHIDILSIILKYHMGGTCNLRYFTINSYARPSLISSNEGQLPTLPNNL